MNWKPLDKIDANLCKGMAILMIVTHNFLHLFPFPKENEFAFYPDKVFLLLSLLWNEPENSVRFLLSFFGHFGVQIFTFLSAYGLTKKYSHLEPKYWVFIWQRIVKIYPVFILAIFAWAIITGWMSHGILGPFKVLYAGSEDLLLKLTLLSNFIPEKSLSPVGPWWFIPFIFQFYFFFPLLLKLYSRGKGSILLLLSASSILFSILMHGKIGNLNIYFTLLGHLPEFCLGIYLAKSDDEGLRIPSLLVVGAFAIYFLGNIFEIFWYATHINFLILLLAIFSYFIENIKNYNLPRKVILFFGSISIHLFLVNGFLRQPFITWANDYNHWFLTLALCLLFLMISIVVALALAKTDKILRLKINRM